MSILTNIKNRWNDYLTKLAEANKRSFGDQKLDCCDLNRPHQSTNSPAPEDQFSVDSSRRNESSH